MKEKDIKRSHQLTSDIKNLIQQILAEYGVTIETSMDDAACEVFDLVMTSVGTIFAQQVATLAAGISDEDRQKYIDSALWSLQACITENLKQFENRK